MFIILNINVSKEGRKGKKIVGHATGDEWLLVLLPMETKYVSCDNTRILRLKLHNQTSIMPYSTDNHTMAMDKLFFILLPIQETLHKLTLVFRSSILLLVLNLVTTWSK